MQDGLLHVHTIFGLLQDHGIGSVEHFIGHFRAAMRRKAVHEHGTRSGLFHEFAIHLVGLEHLAADLFFRFKAHAGPRIGVDGLAAAHGFLRIGEEFDFGAGFLGNALGIGQNIGIRRVIRGSGNANVNAEASGEVNERMADVVAVANIGELESLQRSRTFLRG